MGVKSVGDLLGFNDSINFIDISSTHMLRNNDVQGYYALNFALKRNKGLKHLVLRNCGLNDNIQELGYVLSRNKGLQVCDMDNNHVKDRWFAPNTFIDTKLIMQMPSIQTSLDRNIAAAADPVLGPRYAVHARPMEAGCVGIWTSRRLWVVKDREGEFERAKQKKLLASEETIRIDAEDDFVTGRAMKEIDRLKHSLAHDRGGQRLVKHVAKVIDMYIKSLEKLSTDHFPPPGSRAGAGVGARAGGADFSFDNSDDRTTGNYPCSTMLCYAMLCHAMPCHAMLCYAILFYNNIVI
jgi:hypothetical protein